MKKRKSYKRKSYKRKSYKRKSYKKKNIGKYKKKNYRTKHSSGKNIKRNKTGGSLSRTMTRTTTIAPPPVASEGLSRTTTRTTTMAPPPVASEGLSRTTTRTQPVTLEDISEGPSTGLDIRVGVFIVGYKGHEHTFTESIQNWYELPGGTPVLFTDSRFEDNEWQNVEEMEVVDMMDLSIPYLDWLIENKDKTTHFPQAYTDIARWYVLDHLNKHFPNSITVFCQASWKYKGGWDIMVDVEKYKGNLVLYGADRGLMVDLETPDHRTITGICNGLDLVHEYVLSRGYFDIARIFSWRYSHPESYSVCVIGSLIKLSTEHIDKRETSIAWFERMNMLKNVLSGLIQEFNRNLVSTISSEAREEKLEEYVDSLQKMVDGKSKVYDDFTIRYFMNGKRYLFESDVGLRIRQFIPFECVYGDLENYDVGVFGIPPFIEKIKIGSWQK